jgi:hypothetical protein
MLSLGDGHTVAPGLPLARSAQSHLSPEATYYGAVSRKQSFVPVCSMIRPRNVDCAGLPNLLAIFSDCEPRVAAANLLGGGGGSGHLLR